ncbi:MAG: hypothetical protein IJ869_04680 [Clostridiales bacterium]|nr:hypothetical protein [Clostridiales bacterium]
MKRDDIMLEGGIRAVFDPVSETYAAEIPHEGVDVVVELQDNEDNPDTAEALQYTFSMLMGDLKGYETKAREAMISKMCPLLEKEPYESVDPAAIREDFKLIHIALVDVDRTNMPRIENTRVEFSFIEPDLQDPDDIRMISAAGSLEEGFREFFVNGVFVSEDEVLMPRPLDNDTLAEFSPYSRTYVGVADLLGEEVECYFELDDDEAGADNAFELYEDVIEAADDLDEQARMLILKNLPGILSDIEQYLGREGDKDQIMEDLFLDAAVFGSARDLDFTYCLEGEGAQLKITVTGTFEGGFSGCITDLVRDDEEFD